MAKNVASSCKDIENWSRGFKNRAKRGYFERDYTKLHTIYFMKKVGGKGLDWCYIGESRRKVAEVGLKWQKLYQRCIHCYSNVKQFS